MNEYLNRMNQPAQTASRGSASVPPQKPAGKKTKDMTKIYRILFVVFSALIAVILIGSMYLLIWGNKKTDISSQINTDKYQAIFLNSSDGQVYFGKLSVLNNEYYQLNDIYYVRVQQVQPETNNGQNQNISLAKLGSEIHGPEDTMYINRGDVLFWENLKDDGQVVKAIKAYQANPSDSNN